MQHIDEDSEVSLRTKIPNWVTAVDRAKKEKVDYIITMLDAFLNDPELLFNALWYAYSNGIAVLVTPPYEGKSTGNTPPKTMIYLREE